MATMLSELLSGLYRWSAPHPDWTPTADADGPDDWGQMVASHLYEAPDTVVLFDPLLPSGERGAFLDRLGTLIAGRPVSILTTIRWHRRDREELAERFRANSPRAWNAVPPGVEQKPLRGAGETAFWLPGAKSLLFGDRLLGDEDGVRLCPESWLRRERVDRAGLAHLLRPLIELPVERLLVSHGEPVLHDGRAVLARAISAVEEG